MLNRIRTYLAIRRVRRMEKLFDTLSAAAPAEIRKSVTLKRKLRALTRYYEGGTWLEDFERDERGEFPADLKRGVLSEDGIYNLLTKDEI
ncbi:MAG: DUF4298 domain-containing protein [Clostridia bacterium]|nr:DUF4298 domain-containing protein [Clostridia bacterium]